MLREWGSLRAELSARLQVTASWPDGFRARTAAGDRVVVEHTPGRRVGWLVVSVAICRQEDMDPERTLERNGTLAFTTLALRDGEYWFRLALPLDSMELDAPEVVLGLCVQSARQLSPARVEVPPGASVCFAHYAE